MNIKPIIRDIPDFPKKGIIFKDITPLLLNPEALKTSVSQLADAAKGLGITKVVGIESRGFIFGAAVALELGAGFVPIRKPGKLPAETLREEYTLEYGTDTIEIHKDALSSGDKVFIIDDLLATGGTVHAAVKLVEKAGANVAKIGFVIELAFLNGRAKIHGYEILSLVTF